MNSVFGGINSSGSQFSGVSQQTTPDELNYQFYRALVLNAAYLFKSMEDTRHSKKKSKKRKSPKRRKSPSKRLKKRSTKKRSFKKIRIKMI